MPFIDDRYCDIVGISASRQDVSPFVTGTRQGARWRDVTGKHQGVC